MGRDDLKGCTELTPSYLLRMSFTEILEEIPKLSFAEREEIVKRALSVDPDLTEEEEAILDDRMRDFAANPESGVPLEEAERLVRQRLERR